MGCQRSNGAKWKRRLYLPCYRISEAARYVGISPQSVGRWHRGPSGKSPLLSQREQRSELSYLQLIEVAVVAAMRVAGVNMAEIREAREYCIKVLGSEFPFAEYKFAKDGKDLLIDYQNIDPPGGDGKFLMPAQGGQLAWSEMIGRRLEEFVFEDETIVAQWRVAGADRPIIIDPRVSFGAPQVQGIATWVIQGRWDAGESLRDIAEDFGLDEYEVACCLEFEGIQPDRSRPNLWVN